MLHLKLKTTFLVAAFILQFFVKQAASLWHEIGMVNSYKATICESVFSDVVTVIAWIGALKNSGPYASSVLNEVSAG